ncbi:MAG: hypothetical protein KC656_30850, partial [Myxococcales bacterium]|nr:hypothetical protein [Myxococcales bacterium]
MREMLRQGLVSFGFDLRIWVREVLPRIGGMFLLIFGISVLPLMWTLMRSEVDVDLDDHLQASMLVHADPADRPELKAGISPTVAQQIAFTGDPAEFDIVLRVPRGGIRASPWRIERDDSPYRVGGWMAAALRDRARAAAADVEPPAHEPDVDDLLPGLPMDSLAGYAALVAFGLAAWLGLGTGMLLGMHRYRGSNLLTRLFVAPLVFYVADGVFMLASSSFGMLAMVSVIAVPMLVASVLLGAWSTLLTVLLAGGALCVCGAAFGMLPGTAVGCWTREPDDNPLTRLSLPLVGAIVVPPLLLPTATWTGWVPVWGAPAAFSTLDPLGWAMQL